MKAGRLVQCLTYFDSLIGPPLSIAATNLRARLIAKWYSTSTHGYASARSMQLRVSLQQPTREAITAVQRSLLIPFQRD